MQLITGRAEGGYAIALPGEGGELMPCRCHFGGPQKQLDLFDAEGHEGKVPIAEVEDLRQYGEALGKRASQWA